MAALSLMRNRVKTVAAKGLVAAWILSSGSLLGCGGSSSMPEGDGGTDVAAEHPAADGADGSPADGADARVEASDAPATDGTDDAPTEALDAAETHDAADASDADGGAHDAPSTDADGGATDRGTADIGGDAFGEEACEASVPWWIADFDGDGVDDCAQGLAASPTMFATIVFYRGIGADRFGGPGIPSPFRFIDDFPSQANLNAETLKLGDVTGDGRADIVLAAPSVGKRGSDIEIFTGQPDGTFMELSSFSSVTQFSSLVPGDFDGDGMGDLVAAGWDPAVSAIHWLTLVSRAPFPQVVDTSTSLSEGVNGFCSIEVVVDLDGDKNLDLVAIDQFLGMAQATSHPQVAVALGTGTGAFKSPSTLIEGTDGVTAVAASDTNGDGKIDLLVTLSAGVTTFYGDGTGGFSTSPPP